MPTYVMLSSLTPEGGQTLHSHPERMEQVNKEISADETFGLRLSSGNAGAVCSFEAGSSWLMNAPSRRRSGPAALPNHTRSLPAFPRGRLTPVQKVPRFSSMWAATLAA